jgi:hypothetical protein
MAHVEALVKRADAVLNQTLGDVLGTPLVPKQWNQSKLPQHHGGLGIGSPVDLQTPGRLATVVDFVLRAPKVLHLQPDLNLLPPDFQRVVQAMAHTLGPEIDPLKGWQSDPQTVYKADTVHSQQRWWGEKWHKARAKQLPIGLTARDQARVNLQQSQRGQPG